jgi:lactoylglutathione lyase
MKGYDHLGFQVGSMDVSLRFYTEKLGFTLVSRNVNPDSGLEFAFLTLGDLSLELLRAAGPAEYRPPEVRPPYCPHLALPTDDMAGVVTKLRQAGVEIVGGPWVHEGESTWMYFLDPDHNILEYIQWLR